MMFKNKDKNVNKNQDKNYNNGISSGKYNIDSIDSNFEEKPNRTGLGKKKWIFIVIGLAFVGFYLGLHLEKKYEQEQVQKEVTVINKKKSESHTRLEYYMTDTSGNEEISVDARCKACAYLVGHTMSTGCKKSYEILLDYFGNSSLEYLQDYLTGKECQEYESPSVVCIEKSDVYQNFLIQVKSKNKYIIRVSLDITTNIPQQFSISEYIERDKIQQQK